MISGSVGGTGGMVVSGSAKTLVVLGWLAPGNNSGTITVGSGFTLLRRSS